MGYSHYFDVGLLKRIESRLRLVRPQLRVSVPDGRIESLLRGKGLKQRVDIIADALAQSIRNSDLNLEEWKEILGPELETEAGTFTQGYWLMPVSRWVETEMIDRPAEALSLIEELTKRHTGEYCLRPFLEKHYKLTLMFAQDWVRHESFHVRRLASEGFRPRLPWARRLRFSSQQIENHIGLLNALKTDPSRYVRKSVANHARDLLKDSSNEARTFVLGLDYCDERESFIRKHALRKIGGREWRI